ncbi:ferrous iron transport protein B [Erwinia sp. OLTSP20]|uniref:Fe(2+) transporter permease subunit FeoB n=1 Tax=unclassified Erwinia TaxID=2622719 RepID=UPI000C175562|nr:MULTISPECIES: Fe(2+) transporter permease subunit FeoB [unclassified Erwinia]PIJ49532.1 ferrous iron transport protein B [Erwinia sp. OAMSP11]PIJ71198.1 ferrous iron transport protein B [Erwinia sp. OLSSP12]PIJ79847.1 ferrous iron transport protein B [Erwinia sp. OLCASP19]PIJ81610.1 ferrous iron transport protein B [Erwinia sp. OLMTSP26]PIJ84025.1 ferrous iron transport protein B [Erwinia sp. OLMDSP33]
MKKITIGLFGNPNAGKTTLFNQLTGARQRVGNWAGVTVERKQGQFTTGTANVTLVDLPGTLSLTTLSHQASLDEQIACQYLLSGEADLIINVVDASCLERSLNLTLELLALGIPCIVALNMLDMAQSQHIDIDTAALAAWLGCPVIPLVSSRGQGIAELKQQIDQPIAIADMPQICYPLPLQQAFVRLAQAMPESLGERHKIWLAQQLLKGDIISGKLAGAASQQVPEELATINASTGSEASILMAEARFQAIAQLCQQVTSVSKAQLNRLTLTLDRVVLNRWAGLPIFFLVMYLMFLLSINLGGALQPLFELSSAAIFIDGVRWLGAEFHLPTWLTVFMAQGIGGGINTVLPLVPQIGLMYLFLSFLEDSGYMARAAFVMDRLMQLLGLPGKSFVPLIVGFGCNVPAIMGARTLDMPRDRQMTVIMAPFMSCGARLAIFAVFAATFFGQHGASIVFSLYVLGILAAIATGLILKHTLMRGEATPFIMDLPLYHIPHIKSLFLQTWMRLKGFILRAGKVIVLASMLIGGLSNFAFNGSIVSNIDQSALADVSKSLTPLLSPIGIQQDNWQATVGLITGAMAKEVVVGTLNTLYTAEAIQQQPFVAADFSLSRALKNAVEQTWQSVKATFSLSVLANPVEASKGDGDMDSGASGTMSKKFGSVQSAYSYLIFVLLYVPCASVMGAITRESGARWMLFAMGWGLNLAWSLATFYYQLATFRQHPASSGGWLLLVVMVNVLLIGGLRWLSSRLAASDNRPADHRVARGCAGCPGSKGCRG